MHSLCLDHGVPYLYLMNQKGCVYSRLLLIFISMECLSDNNFGLERDQSQLNSKSVQNLFKLKKSSLAHVKTISKFILLISKYLNQMGSVIQV